MFSNEDEDVYDDNYVKDNIFINATTSKTDKDKTPKGTDSSKTMEKTVKQPEKAIHQADTSGQEPVKAAESTTGKEKCESKYFT